MAATRCASSEAAQSSREAIVLIWSNDAPSQHYMLEWLHGIDPSRLVEVARAPGAPRLERRAADGRVTIELHADNTLADLAYACIETLDDLDGIEAYKLTSVPDA